MKIIYDLDGTLICSKKRLHELFLDLLESGNIEYLAYWNYKFSGSNNQAILRDHFGYSTIQINIFLRNWMAKIESDYYLDMDTIVPGAIETLENYSRNNELYICTARQSITQVHKQLKNLGIFGFFRGIFVTEQKASKDEILNNSDILFTKKDWLIGDTGHDINAGKKIGTQTCAVLSGFMSEASLATYSPDLIIENITFFDG